MNIANRHLQPLHEAHAASADLDLTDYLQGKAYLKLGQLSQAIESFRLAVQRHPDHTEANYELAQALTNVGQRQEAEHYFLAALNTRQGASFQLYKAFGEFLTREEQWERACDYYLKALRVKQTGDKLSFGAFLFRKFTQEQSERLIPIFQEIIALDPQCFPAYKILGDLLANSGRDEAAAAMIRTGYYQQLARSKRNHPFLKQYPYRTGKPWNEDRVLGPDFIVLGSWKCATSSLYRYIAQHPNVVPAFFKEIHFFNQKFHYGIDWYLSHFPPIPQNSGFITGEATPSYLSHPEAPQRVFERFPTTKLIVILRNPVDRTISHYNMNLRYNLTKDRFFETAKDVVQPLKSWYSQGLDNIDCKSTQYLGGSLYIYPIKRWLKLFPREQLLILKTEDLAAQPQQTMDQVFRFLNLPAFEQGEYDLVNKGSYEVANSEVRQILSEFFQPFNRDLEAFTGLQMNWDQ